MSKSEEEKEKVAEKDGYFKTRDVLWYLVFTGFAINYMIRINLNLSIVSMVRNKPYLNFDTECASDKNEELKLNLTLPEELASNFSSIATFNISTEPPILTTTHPQINTQDDSHLFDWDEYEQALVLGAFFWLHWVTQVPGGILAKKYGTKIVFGLSNYSGVLLCFLIPVCSYLGYKYLIALRVIQGLLIGFTWPSMHNMVAQWVPPNERSKFVTAYLGSSIGAGITCPMCGYLIHSFGWESVYYVCGVIGTVWYVMWYFFVYDTPDEHPRISEHERKYIKASLGTNVTKEKIKVPWKDILTSMPMWMNVLAQWGGIWGLFTLMTHAPTYIKVIHRWDVRSTGILSGFPHIIRTIWAVAFSQLGDYLLRTNKMSRTNVRKVATAVCCIGQGVCVLSLAYSGCDKYLAIVFFTLAVAIHGAVSTGPLASLVDLSPNFASIQLGICSMVSVLPGFISPIIVGSLTLNNQTIGQWQKVFWISSAMSVICGLIYVFFSKSELQTWNKPKKDESEDKELALLSKPKLTEPLKNVINSI